jgi:HD-GYP domain-containing protein (c-di-GMP phosphodiesterase class II)
MRYITTEQLRPGMKVARAFFGRLGGAMLQKGFVLTQTAIDRILDKQYSGLYIEDGVSKGIEVDEMVSGDLRGNVTKAVRRVITNIELSKDNCFNSDMRRLSKLLNSLIDEIMASDIAVVNIMDVKEFDLYTYQHSVNVCVLSCVIGLVYNFSRKEMFNLALAAILHDVGKIRIDKAILNKPGKLTAEEFELVKRHSLDGYNILKQRGAFPGEVLAAILQHHERYDGSGYMDGRRGGEIQLFAQIIAVVDVYDAITSKRPYHEPILPSEAYEYIMGNAGRAFSMEIVDAFTKKVAPFPLGAQVRLSNGETGVVYKNHSDFLMRPLIRLHPPPGSLESRYPDLKNDSAAYNVTIQKVFA